MRRLLALALIGVCATTASCGSGGGAGNPFDVRAVFWGIPFVPSGSSTPFFVGFRNFTDTSATVEVQGFRPDGTPYSALVVFEVDAFGELHVSINTALGGNTPDGGMLVIRVPSGRLDVFFNESDLPFDDESAKGSQLPDLVLPPPRTRAGITSTTQTSLIQISNASAAATTIDVTPFREPQADPALPPDQEPTVTLAFAPHETKVFDPDGLSGITGFFGSFFFESPEPFFVAAKETGGEISFDTQVSIETRFLAISEEYLSTVGLRFGRETTPTAENHFDFVMLARNDSEEAQTLTIQGIFDEGGQPLIPFPRTVLLDPHESRVADTLDPLFEDVFGDVLLQSGLRRVYVFLNIPAAMDVTFRQFDPIGLDFKAALETTPVGHVFEVPDVRPTAPGRFDVNFLMNPSNVPIEIDVTVLVPEPPGFDATPVPQDPVVVPPFGLVTYVLAPTEFLDRDLEPVPFVGLRFSSPRAFGVTAVHERRDALDRMEALSPNIRSNVEDGRN